MRKKILLAFITITLAGTLTACGGAEEKETKNNTSSVQSEKTDDAKGDGSIIPQSVTIDGVKYTKDSKIEDFLEHGWSIEGYDKEQEVEETRFTLTKDDKEINVTAYADETTAVLKERTIDVVYAVNLSGKNDVEFKLSNGIALGESNKIIDEIYESVKDEIHIMNQNGAVKTACMDYSNEDGMVNYAYYNDEEMGKDKIINISIAWYK